MPLKIRSRIIASILLLFFKVNYSQSGNSCLTIDDTGIINKAFNSFEKDLFKYYNFGNDSTKTYRTFLAEVASLSLDLRKLPSDNSIQLTRKFKQIASDKKSLWIKLSEYESQDIVKKSYTDPSIKKDEKEVLIFNYRGGFIQCLKNTSSSEDFKDIINNLENDGNVSTSLISQKIYYLTDKEFSTLQVKNFIAFDIYYSILMVIEKAFK
ncbi:hypothetical protein [Aquimarina algicola]|uniref:Uncharacterized protein n=1 Tax=Aquimarina algicola TaxID=2589995 RepID=A0A504J483_9FLAO|nr:hypothetical protein [Aquimarina algicola]TPN85274.1 hypothetical protein FHK87_14730 [Aquimarina algicola]